MIRVVGGILVAAWIGANPAHAQVCTDFAVETSVGMSNLFASGGWAQSFVAPCGDVRSVAVFLDTWAYDGRDITVRIRQGAGVSGAVVGEFVQAPPAGAYGYTTFDLSSIDLVAGQTYTLELIGAASRWAIAFNQAGVSGPDYPDGHAWVGGVERPDLDLRFRFDFGPYLPVCEDAAVTTANGSYSLWALGPMGQSFVATCEDLRSFEVSLSPSGGTGSPDLTLRLHEGAGMSGPVVAEVTQTPANSHTGFYAFDVGSVTLVPGQTYTAEVVAAGSFWMLQGLDGGTAYPNGYMWLNGAFTGGQDLKFRIGFGLAPAPAPVAAQQIAGETFAAEDIPTSGSDGDYNDAALYYNRRCTFGAGGERSTETIHFRGVSAGATKHNALVLTLPATPRNVTLVDPLGVPRRPAVDGARLILFDDFRDAFTAPTGTFLNTTDDPLTDAPVWRLEVEYAAGPAGPVECGPARFGVARPAENVLIDLGSTMEGTNLPLVGSFPGSFQVPRETEDLLVAYPEAAAWLQGLVGGCAAPDDCHDDWYLGPAAPHVVERGDLAVTLPLPALPSCRDREQNAEETNIDCGGVCGRCPELYDCSGALVDTTGMVVHQFQGSLGQVTAMPGPGGGTPPRILEYSEVAGWYAFDPTVSPSWVYADPIQTEYTFAPGAARLVVWHGLPGGAKRCMETAAEIDPAGQIYLQDDPAAGDRYVLSQFYLRESGDAPENYGEIYVSLDDPGGLSLSGMALPVTPPDPATFAQSSLVLSYRHDGAQEFGEGVVTSLTGPTEPSCSDGLRNRDEQGPDCGGSCPDSCPNGGAAGRVVFVSSELLWGDINGVDGADGACQWYADNAGLSGQFLAWISTVSGYGAPAYRFVQSDGPYVRVDGEIIAADWADLTDGTALQNPISLDEYGQDWSGSDFAVWSNVDPYGMPLGDDCWGWSASMPFAHGGFGVFSTLSSPTWTQAGADSCGNLRRLYCFQQ